MRLKLVNHIDKLVQPKDEGDLECNFFFVIYFMSITRGVLAQSPEPKARDKVLDNNPDRIGIWKCWFLRRGENRSTRRKTSRSKDENQQQTQPTYDAE